MKMTDKLPLQVCHSSEPVKRPEKLQQTILFFCYFDLSKKIRLNVSCESSA